MVKSIRESLPKRDDPIFKTGPTIYTPKSARDSTPSTKPSLPEKDADESAR